MLIDNFTQIGEIIAARKESDDDFFFLQIIRRRKDPGNIDIGADNVIVHFMEISSADDLQANKERIIDICNKNNARAYIHLNKRSKQQIALKMLAELATRISNNDYHVKNIYASCCGKFTSEKQKLWILDADTTSIRDIVLIENAVRELVLLTGKEPVIHRIPTKNGYHVVCNSFNVKQFQDDYSLFDITIQKDNPTVLYIPA